MSYILHTNEIISLILQFPDERWIGPEYTEIQAETWKCLRCRLFNNLQQSKSDGRLIELDSEREKKITNIIQIFFRNINFKSFYVILCYDRMFLHSHSYYEPSNRIKMLLDLQIPLMIKNYRNNLDVNNNTKTAKLATKLFKFKPEYIKEDIEEIDRLNEDGSLNEIEEIWIELEKQLKPTEQK